jgi:hypothetical protein
MPARKPVRRSQLISPFGVGAITNFPGDESIMTAGLEAWPFALEECPSDWQVKEERLQGRLRVDHLRLPPEHRDPGPGVAYPNQDIPYVRFPRWHYCHRCGFMQYAPLFQLSRNRCRGYRFDKGMDCSELPEKRRPYLIPMRILTACAKGHVQDFPFLEWVHQDAPLAGNCTLRFRAGRSSASLAGIKISCTCGAERSLAGVFDFGEKRGGALHRIGYDCRGEQPWLGRESGDQGSCGEYLRVVQRGASNVYFPYVVSSIYLPLWGENTERPVVRALENSRYWDMLTSGTVEGKYIDPLRAEVIAGMLGLDAGELRAAAQRKLEGVISEEELPTEEEYRRQEYDALREGRGGANTDLLVEVRQPEEYGSGISGLFSRICLIRKLRETRALAGFTRLLPPEGDPQSERLQPLKINSFINWLPAITVRGEGIFFEFSLPEIEEWLRKVDRPASRIRALLEAYDRNRVARGQEPREATPKFVMMHTFAHMLINQLSFDCGYGSASLKERIYCDFEEGSEPMQGVLIYTASGDSEGTMGGLVRQGEPDRLPDTIERAAQKAQWCSSDPVCIESTGQGTDNANLAACHACVLVSETSCEEGNRLLDRAMVVGTPGDAESGFLQRTLTETAAR